jgi:predicted transcriptional regulator
LGDDLSYYIWTSHYSSSGVHAYVEENQFAEPLSTEAGFETVLTEAYEQREAMSALAREDWLGLRLLELMSSNEERTASELAERTGAPIDIVAGILAQLTAARILDVEEGRAFILTERGDDLIDRIKRRATVAASRQNT